MNSTIESSRQFWDAKAKENPYWYVSSYGPYDGRNLDEFWQSGIVIWDAIKSTAGFVAHGTVVEIGCGVGRLTRAISREVSQVFAFDISSEMIEIARREPLSNVCFHLASGVSLAPVPDKSADLVLAYCVFQHLPDLNCLRSYLNEMVRVAKPGGMIAFTLCERDWKWSLLPLMRLKGFVKSTLALQPPGLHKREWLGIRPSISEVIELSPVVLSVADLGAERILLWGSVL